MLLFYYIININNIAVNNILLNKISYKIFLIYTVSYKTPYVSNPLHIMFDKIMFDKILCLIHSFKNFRTTSYFHFFIVYILAPYAF